MPKVSKSLEPREPLDPEKVEVICEYVDSFCKINNFHFVPPKQFTEQVNSQVSYARKILHSTHHKKHPCCPGKLVWNEERSLQWGLSWKAVLSCTNCSYISDVYRIYEEAGNGITKTGPKPATVTSGSQVDLSKIECPTEV